MKTPNDLILQLYKINAIKFGNFVLKSGIESPVYFDLRVIVSYPSLMRKVSNLMWEIAKENNCIYNSVCGVPYTALPIATCISVDFDKPMLIRRKEAKDYGTKKLIEGSYAEGDTCLVIEDVVTSGTSVFETVQALESVGIKVTDAVVLLDREQGGAALLAKREIKLHSVCKLTEVLEVLHEEGCLTDDLVARTQAFINENRFDKEVSTVPSPVISSDESCKKLKLTLGWSERSASCSHLLTSRLYKIMHQKQTNLAVSVDLHTCQQILQLVDTVGPYVCVVKTHIDIVEDFTPEFTQQLKQLAQKHSFLIFEDRKFADIGNTVKSQYCRGVYRISEWADIVNTHPLPGPGVISGLKEVAHKESGCLLVAEMSSSGNLISKEYTQASLRMAEANEDFVIGFICQSRLTKDPKFIHMMPGVKLASGGDNLGQQYSTPEDAIVNRGADVIIVGRGITQAEDVKLAAKSYQEAGYAAYLRTLKDSS